jgi:hypothetical protein
LAFRRRLTWRRPNLPLGRQMSFGPRSRLPQLVVVTFLTIIMILSSVRTTKRARPFHLGTNLVPRLTSRLITRAHLCCPARISVHWPGNLSVLVLGMNAHPFLPTTGPVYQQKPIKTIEVGHKLGHFLGRTVVGLQHERGSYRWIGFQGSTSRYAQKARDGHYQEWLTCCLSSEQVVG